jgi:hypothetical protein
MRLIHIRAGTEAEATCLMRELSVYEPKRSRRTILVELERDQSERLLLGLLAASRPAWKPTTFAAFESNSTDVPTSSPHGAPTSAKRSRASSPVSSLVESGAGSLARPPQTPAEPLA